MLFQCNIEWISYEKEILNLIQVYHRRLFTAEIEIEKRKVKSEIAETMNSYLFYV